MCSQGDGRIMNISNIQFLILLSMIGA
jgi:hypothetical protein